MSVAVDRRIERLKAKQVKVREQLRQARRDARGARGKQLERRHRAIVKAEDAVYYGVLKSGLSVADYARAIRRPYGKVYPLWKKARWRRAMLLSSLLEAENELGRPPTMADFALPRSDHSPKALRYGWLGGMFRYTTAGTGTLQQALDDAHAIREELKEYMD